MENWTNALTRAHSMALTNYTIAVDQRDDGDYRDLKDALRAYRENVADSADEAGYGSHEKVAALEFYDGLVKANKGSTNLRAIAVPMDCLIHDEIIEMPRSAFTQEEFDALDIYDQEEIHEKDYDSRVRISEMSHSLMNRLDWIDEGYHDDDDYFADILSDAVKRPDFFDIIPDNDGSIQDLMDMYADILGVSRVEEALMDRLSDADHYRKEHVDVYSSNNSPFVIGIGRNFYLDGPDDINSLYSAYPDEIQAALDRVEQERPWLFEEVGLNLDVLLDLKSGTTWGFNVDLDPTYSYVYTPDWDTIREQVEDELVGELPDEPLESDDERTYEERKIYTFEDGAYWVELTTEELPEESVNLGHCVGQLAHGYPQMVRDGEVRVFSLRIPSGRSKLTIAINSLNMVKDLRGKGNRIAGWGGKLGEGRVKWMEIQKVGKLLEILNVPWPPEMRSTLEAVKNVVGGPVFTQNPSGQHCQFCAGSLDPNMPLTQNPAASKDSPRKRILRTAKVIAEHAKSNNMTSSGFATFAELEDESFVPARELMSVVKKYSEELGAGLKRKIEYVPSSYTASGRGAFGGQGGRVVPGGVPASYTAAGVRWSKRP